MMRNAFVLLVAAAASAVPVSAQTATAAQKEALRSHCVKDFEALCSGVPRGGVPAFKCLEEHVASLSSACKAAVTAVDPDGATSEPAAGN
jgi:hypothetical protein